MMTSDAGDLRGHADTMVNVSLDAAAGAASSAGARHAHTRDDQLTLLATRMGYVSLSFFFACFYFAIVYLQLVDENGLWLPTGIDHPPAWMGVVGVGLLLIGGLVYFWGQWAGLYQGYFNRLSLALWVTSILNILAVIVHIIELHAPGFSLQGGGYVSCFIALEGTFTVLLIIATLVSLGMANRARLGLFRESGIAVEAFGEFYGWLTAVALLNFLALYVQPFFPTAG